jgi:putative effector of murein hydrolase
MHAQLYRFRQPLRTRSLQIVGSAVLSTFVSLLCAAGAARLARLAPVLGTALYFRTTTTALSPELGRLLNTAPALGLVAAFVTGLLAITAGKATLDALGVRDPTVRGLALTSTAHGGAVVALSDEPEAFPYAVLMYNLGAAAAVGLFVVLKKGQLNRHTRHRPTTTLCHEISSTSSQHSCAELLSADVDGRGPLEPFVALFVVQNCGRHS